MEYEILKDTKVHSTNKELLSGIYRIMSAGCLDVNERRDTAGAVSVKFSGARWLPWRGWTVS
jgi:hypothetical protein